jgi:hypothetical protein
VTEAVALLSEEVSGRRAILLLTDGQSTEDDPLSAMNSAGAAASTQTVPVYLVGLGYQLDFSLLMSLAQQTGGSSALVSDAQVLAGVFDAIGVASTKGRVVVHGKGQFQPPVSQVGQYRISGILRTLFGGNFADTSFEFSVYLK